MRWSGVLARGCYFHTKVLRWFACVTTFTWTVLWTGKSVFSEHETSHLDFILNTNLIFLRIKWYHILVFEVTTICQIRDFVGKRGVRWHPDMKDFSASNCLETFISKRALNFGMFIAGQENSHETKNAKAIALFLLTCTFECKTSTAG